MYGVTVVWCQQQRAYNTDNTVFCEPQYLQEPHTNNYFSPIIIFQNPSGTKFFEVTVIWVDSLLLKLSMDLSAVVQYSVFNPATYSYRRLESLHPGAGMPERSHSEMLVSPKEMESLRKGDSNTFEWHHVVLSQHWLET